MPLILLGLSHETAPITLRECVAVPEARLAESLKDLKQQPGVLEAFIVSTCNRSEFYCRIATEADRSLLSNWICSYYLISAEELEAHSYRKFNTELIRHLIRVAAGMDSMVLGEPQILGQVKTAFAYAEEAKTTGTVLHRLLEMVFSASKTIRTDTAMGENSVSVASCAVKLARQLYGHLTEQTVLLIGAGEMIELSLRHLQQQGVTKFIIANRSRANAEKLAVEFNAKAISLEQLESHLPDADIVFSSTAAQVPILTRPMVTKCQKQRRHRPLLLVDIAVPRDIAADVAKISSVYLYSIDDLQKVLESNLKMRASAATEAEVYVEQYLHEFLRWWRGHQVASSIRKIRERSHTITEIAVAAALQQLSKGKDPEAVIRALGKQLTNKLLHTPSTRLREAAADENREIMDAAIHLFDIKPENDKADDSTGGDHSL
ncbi:MAG: glutamyl-tRNA reductase [Proteobacteria bacterium]|nr:glutamyl-tRNA reductase [Pseudomonadota bacterium]